MRLATRNLARLSEIGCLIFLCSLSEYTTNRVHISDDCKQTFDYSWGGITHPVEYINRR